MLSPDSNTRELFLEECLLEASSWDKEDAGNLKEFLFSPTGKKVLGKLQQMWKERLIATIGIRCHDPYSAAASLSFAQGEVRGVLSCLDRLFEMEPISVDS